MSEWTSNNYNQVALPAALQMAIMHILFCDEVLSQSNVLINLITLNSLIHSTCSGRVWPIPRPICLSLSIVQPNCMLIKNPIFMDNGKFFVTSGVPSLVLFLYFYWKKVSRTKNYQVKNKKNPQNQYISRCQIGGL